MPCFEDFNTENKLRIPLSAYAAQIIDNDCLAFSQKKTTLINAVILNYYQNADCSISLRLRDFRAELKDCFPEKKANEDIIERLVEGRAKKLSAFYSQKKPADMNWQITLNKKVKEFLTQDTYTCEERYYGQRPGRYVRSIIEEYAQLPYYRREEIVYKELLDTINAGIKGHYILNLKNVKGSHISIRPYSIETDPLSMYHYLVGYSVPHTDLADESEPKYPAQVLSIRISRLVSAEIQFLQSGKISDQEARQIQRGLQQKSVQFVSGRSSTIKVRLTDAGIKKYEAQLHLRPNTIGRDPADDHIYLFECTEAQILYYFFSFGKDVMVLEPQSLAEKFTADYKEALQQYNI